MHVSPVLLLVVLIFYLAESGDITVKIGKRNTRNMHPITLYMQNKSFYKISHLNLSL